MKKYFKILIIFVVIIIIYFIVKKYVFKSKPQKIQLTNTALNKGLLTDTELNRISYKINENIKGITIFGESDTLNLMLVLSDIDLIRLYNIYIDNFNTSLYSDVFDEWYWSVNQSVADTLKQKFINLQINQ